MTDFQPTDEQLAALAAFKTGGDLVIEAGAGTGKTSTLVILANADRRPGQYIAFNKAIVTDAGAKLPSHVPANTAHSLAFRAIGKNFQHRLNAGRMKSSEIATRLGVQGIGVKVGPDFKSLSAGYLGSLCLRAVTRFCQSADEQVTERHFPYIDGIDMHETGPDGTTQRGFTNNREVHRQLLPAARRAWEDFQRQDGQLPYRHEHYLKLWQLSDPRIAADVIYFDEAQDANPVIAAIVAAQTDAQKVYVGDSQQAIYEFTGAVNAMATFDAARVFLSQSFRFGPEIAAVANRLLGLLSSDLSLRGLDSIPSTVGFVDSPAAVLTRTNAGAVRRMFEAIAAGRRPHLVGGGGEVVGFARAARDLQANGWTAFPDLACFTSWGEVQAYVEDDPQGDELKLLVDLIDAFGVDAILAALERMPREADADVIVSTAHKSKGREWPSVVLGGDFPEPGETFVEDSELRLLYVAATRGRLALDVGPLEWLVAGAVEAAPASAFSFEPADVELSENV